MVPSLFDLLGIALDLTERLMVREVVLAAVNVLNPSAAGTTTLI
jgi:hypothetical protein